MELAALGKYIGNPFIYPEINAFINASVQIKI
jgi:hypothetical protein